jgi:hypothetical protein
MASRTTKDAPSRRPDIENDLTNKFNVGWNFVEGVNTEAFDIDASLDNQARFEALDEATVVQYVEALQRGDIFPAVVAYRKRNKLIIIDGNHRLVAHDRAGEAIDVYEIEAGTRSQTITRMTYALNTTHGRGTSPDERIHHALWMVDNNATIAQAATEVNIKEADIRRAVNKRKAEARAIAAGVDPREWDTLGGAAKTRLLNVSTDEGLKDAVHLSAIAGLDANEVFELVSQVNESGRSAARQRAIIKAKTIELQDRIQAGGSGVFNSKTNRRGVTPKARLGMVIGQVAALPEDVAAIAKTFASAERDEIVQHLEDASQRLHKIALAIKS